MGKDIEAYNAHSCDVCDKTPREAFDGSLRVTRCAEGKRLVKLADQELKREQPGRYEANRKYWRDKRKAEKDDQLQKREETPMIWTEALALFTLDENADTSSLWCICGQQSPQWRNDSKHPMYMVWGDGSASDTSIGAWAEKHKQCHDPYKLFDSDDDSYTLTLMCKCGEKYVRRHDSDETDVSIGQWVDEHKECYKSQVRRQQARLKQTIVEAIAASKRRSSSEQPGAIAVSVIEACPFAHEVVNGVSRVELGEFNNTYMQCGDCGAQGPSVGWRTLGAEAIVREMWNARRLGRIIVAE